MDEKKLKSICAKFSPTTKHLKYFHDGEEWGVEEWKVCEVMHIKES